ncbi:MAG: transcription antitermination factor NusB [Bacteroidetes bacterium 4572_117]|nr:MAG: transcription antitermination factor NusB [Bacteroidetes bacterium 4572_117]
MISRRLIRIKALQILYASSKKKEISSTNAEKELFHSIEKYYDLYHMLISLITEIVEYENWNNDLKRKKNIPTASDLNPDLGLQDNLLVKKLSENIELAANLEKRKINWKIHKDFIKHIYSDFTKSPIYTEFVDLENHLFRVDQELVVRFYSEFLADSERFVDFLEEENIYWNDDASFVIAMVIKTIRNFNLSSDKYARLLPLFKNNDDREFAKMLLRKTIVNREEHLKIIDSHTRNWDTDRIAQIDLLTLQLAIAEVIEFESIPIKVSLNEYIEISKYYSTSKSKTFINGLLDKIIKALKEDNKIKKVGRGLIE